MMIWVFTFLCIGCLNGAGCFDGVDEEISVVIPVEADGCGNVGVEIGGRWTTFNAFHFAIDFELRCHFLIVGDGCVGVAGSARLENRKN